MHPIIVAAPRPPDGSAGVAILASLIFAAGLVLVACAVGSGSFRMSARPGYCRRCDRPAARLVRRRGEWMCPECKVEDIAGAAVDAIAEDATAERDRKIRRLSPAVADRIRRYNLSGPAR